MDVIGVASLNNNKISSEEAFLLFSDATWGVWFGNGERNLSTSTSDPILSDALISIAPNPTSGELVIEYLSDKDCKNCLLTVYNLEGRPVKNDLFLNTSGKIDISELISGHYFISLRTEAGIILKKIIKL
jgi:hypothetical protein